jgi:hypothetical protein
MNIFFSCQSKKKILSDKIQLNVDTYFLLQVTKIGLFVQALNQRKSIIGDEDEGQKKGEMQMNGRTTINVELFFFTINKIRVDGRKCIYVYMCACVAPGIYTS